jgi:hypothetical protein
MCQAAGCKAKGNARSVHAAACSAATSVRPQLSSRLMLHTCEVELQCKDLKVKALAMTLRPIHQDKSPSWHHELVDLAFRAYPARQNTIMVM